MKKHFCLIAFIILPSFALAQKATNIALNKEKTGRIAVNDSAIFTMSLKKDNYYSIVVMQKGIDLVVDLKNSDQKTITEMDSPNGKYGPEKIDFSPDENANFKVLIKPLNDSSNSTIGDYSIIVKEAPKSLERFSKSDLLSDLEILKHGFIETQVGLWYNSYAQLDSICNDIKSKIKDKMTSLEFYRIMAPLGAFVKEGHANIKLPQQTAFYLSQYGKMFPFFIKVLNNKVYVINDIDNYKAKGLLLTSINGQSIDSIMKLFVSLEPSDGFNVTSKYRWVETSFARYYMRFFDAVDAFTVTLTDPKTNTVITYNNVPAVNLKQYNSIRKKVSAAIPGYEFKKAFYFTIDSIASIATITVNTFNTNNFDNGREGFKNLLASSFKAIADQHIQHLILDIRRNEGGAQGMEDHLLSYLTDQQNPKYKFVEIPGFDYSFLPYTEYKDSAAKSDFEKDLQDYFYRANNGRYLDKPGKYKADPPALNNFKGDLYILISGLTFSGGSEFAALAKNYTKAKFIGEEAGGGYYGNTSGEFFEFVLPHSGLKGRIPLFKFVIETKENNIPYGHGVIPDQYIQPTIDEYLNGYDAEVEYVKKMIRK